MRKLGKKKSDQGLRDELKPKNTGYDYDSSETMKEFVDKNVDRLMPIYEKGGMDAIEDEWFATRLQSCTGDFKELSGEEIDDALWDNEFDEAVEHMWMMEYANEVKPRLVYELTKNSEVHNACLNIMYENYKDYCRAKQEEPLGFEDFLVTPIKMYRGGSGKEYEKASAFSSYTFDRDAAETFKKQPWGHGKASDDGVIYEAEIRPIDTYGSLRANGEMEIFVPRPIAPNGRRDEDDVREDGDDGWERYNPVKWFFEEYGIKKSEFVNSVLDTIVSEAGMLKLFDGKKDPSSLEMLRRGIDSVQKGIVQLTMASGKYNADGVFFSGELDKNIGERNVLYPEVQRYRERRRKRLDVKGEPDGWITVNGNHIPIDEEGNPIGGQEKAFGGVDGRSKKTNELNKRLERLVGEESDPVEKMRAFKKVLLDAPVGQSFVCGGREYRKLVKTDDPYENAYAIGNRGKPSIPLYGFDGALGSVDYEAGGKHIPKFIDHEEKVRECEKKVARLREEGKVSGSDEMKENEKGLINSGSRNYGKPGDYAVYRSGDVSGKKMNFFSVDKAGADAYAMPDLGRETVGQYSVHLENPLVIEGENDVECAWKAYSALGGERLKGELTKSKWKQLDRANHAALGKSGHDAIIYIIGGSPAEIQLTGAKASSDLKKLAEYSVTKWGKKGRDLESAIYDGSFDEDPKDFVRVDSRFDEEGRWITTDNGHKVHLNEEGEPDKGNKQVIAAMGGKNPSGPRPASRIEYKKSALDGEKRKEYGKKFAEYAEAMTEANRRCAEELKGVEKGQKGIPYSKRDYSKLRAEQRKRKELIDGLKSTIAELPVGTLLEHTSTLYEKVDGGWMVKGPRDDFNKGKPMSEDRIISWLDDEDRVKPAAPIKCIESTNDLEMVRSLELKSDETYKSFADSINGHDRKEVVARAKKDPEFKELIDGITLYTQGAYGEQKDEANYMVEHGTNEALLMTASDYYADSLYVIKQLWNGQKLAESDSSVDGGVLSMIGAINNSEKTTNELYRIADDRRMMNAFSDNNFSEGTTVYHPPKVGDRIKFNAPTSFTKDAGVMDEIAHTKYGDIVRYTLEPGASALDIEQLSRYKQRESLCCGEYEVVGVDVKKEYAGMLRKGTPRDEIYRRELADRLEDTEGDDYTLYRYNVKVRIKQVGKTEIGKREDSGVVYHDCGEHFDDEERWITTKDGHKVHLNEEGEPDKGNPHVTGLMKRKLGPGMKPKKSSLSKEQIDEYQSRYSELEKKIADMSHAIDKLKGKEDMPEEFWKEYWAYKDEGKKLVSELPVGTILARGTVYFEKTSMREGGGEDNWKMVGKDHERSVDDAYVAYKMGLVDRMEDPYPPTRFVESTSEVGMVEDISPAGSEKCEEWLKDFQKMTESGSRAGIVKRAKKDPEFKSVVDNIVAYTEGGYMEQKKIAREVVKNGVENVDAKTVGEMVSNDGYKYRDLWRSQGLETSEASVAEGMANIIGLINNSQQTTAPLYRMATDNALIIDPAVEDRPLYKPPRVGDKIKFDAPTSFTKDESVLKDLVNYTRGGDKIKYVLEPGAQALDIEGLSRYKQRESLACGEYEVVDVKVEKEFAGWMRPDMSEAMRAKYRERLYEGDDTNFFRYNVEVRIRQVGKTSIGKREDGDFVYYDCAEHFDADIDDDGRWITTENGHHVHINEEGEPDKGNPHVIEKMGPLDRIAENDRYYKSRQKAYELSRELERANADLSYVNGYQDRMDRWAQTKAELQKYLDEHDEKEAEREAIAAEEESNEAFENNEWDRYRDAHSRLNHAREVLSKIKDAKDRIPSIEHLMENERKPSEDEIREKTEKLKDVQRRANIEDGEFQRAADERRERCAQRFKKLSDCKSSSDVEDYLYGKGYYKDDYTHEYGETKLSGIGVNAAKKVAGRIDSLMTDYPFMVGRDGCIRNVFISRKDDAYAVAEANGVIKLNDKWWSSPKKLKESYDDSVRRGFHPAGLTFESIIDHEFVHEIERVLNERLKRSHGEWAVASDMVARRVTERLNKWQYSGGLEDLMRMQTSGYAYENLGVTHEGKRVVAKTPGYGKNTEWLAEAISEARCSKAPREIAVLANEELNKLIREVFG